jgi:uncharacterized membrane protein
MDHMGGMWLWWIAGLLVLVVVVWLLYLLARQGDDGVKQKESPEERLKRRFADGEIDEETYERALEELRK